MPAMTAEDKLDFILNVLKNTADFKPDYRQIASETGCVNANKAQIKFKKIIDDTGRYTLTGGQILAVGSDADADVSVAAPIPSTPKAVKGKGRARKKAAATTPDNDGSGGDDNDNDDAADRGHLSTPAAKKRKTVSLEA